MRLFRSCLLVAFATSNASGQQVEFDFVSLDGMFRDDEVNDLNNRGVVVGNVDTPNGVRPAQWSLEDGLEVLSNVNQNALADAINDAGQVAGTFVQSFNDVSVEAFRWDDGVVEELGMLINDEASASRDISSNGQIGGVSGFQGSDGRIFIAESFLTSDSDLNPVFFGGLDRVNDIGQACGTSGGVFFFDGTQTSEIGVPTGPFSFARAVGLNNSELMVGFAAFSDGFSTSNRTSFYWQGVSEGVEIPVPSGEHEATDVNNLGWIIGNSDDGPYRFRIGGSVEFLEDLIDLPAGTELFRVLRINDAGQILGLARPIGGGFGTDIPFLSTPINVGVSYCDSTPNSTGAAAELTALGSLSAADQDLTLQVSPVPDARGLFIFGLNQVQLPLGDGFLCVLGNFLFFPANPFEGSQVAQLPLTVPIGADGVTVQFQYAFRDNDAGGNLNFSNGLALTFTD